MQVSVFEELSQLEIEAIVGGMANRPGLDIPPGGGTGPTFPVPPPEPIRI
jgi:hypothetical protein